MPEITCLCDCTAVALGPGWCLLHHCSSHRKPWCKSCNVRCTAPLFSTLVASVTRHSVKGWMASDCEWGGGRGPREDTTRPMQSQAATSIRGVGVVMTMRLPPATEIKGDASPGFTSPQLLSPSLQSCLAVVRVVSGGSCLWCHALCPLFCVSAPRVYVHQNIPFHPLPLRLTPW